MRSIILSNLFNIPYETPKYQTRASFLSITDHGWEKKEKIVAAFVALTIDDRRTAELRSE